MDLSSVTPSTDLKLIKRTKTSDLQSILRSEKPARRGLRHQVRVQFADRALGQPLCEVLEFTQVAHTSACCTLF